VQELPGLSVRSSMPLRVIDLYYNTSFCCVNKLSLARVIIIICSHSGAIASP
jgi:hypothetical protein